MNQDFVSDLAAIRGLASIPLMLDVVCRVTGMGFAAVARVTQGRWVCLAAKDTINFGLGAGGELEVETTLCNEVRQAREPVVIDEVARDTTYCRHATPALYGFQSYISVPIFLKDGSFYGTLCAIDPKPAKLRDTAVPGMFRLFADLIARDLETALVLADTQAALTDARGTEKLRDEFTAVLGHDLRNPLASISAGVNLLERMPQNEKGRSILTMMRASVRRMTTLIDNVLDLARGRLGSGLTADRRLEAVLPTLQQVVDEMRLAHPECAIETDLSITRPIDVDREQLSRLLSNLLSNAVMYGTPGRPVRVTASTDAEFSVAVVNHGPPIPAATAKKLFVPFARGEVVPGKQGLGLGLHIALEIARAHGGTIEVVSAGEETRFTFRMPL
jgi:signal transduction histidine kinase